MLGGIPIEHFIFHFVSHRYTCCFSCGRGNDWRDHYVDMVSRYNIRYIALDQLEYTDETAHLGSTPSHAAPHLWTNISKSGSHSPASHRRGILSDHLGMSTWRVGRHEGYQLLQRHPHGSRAGNYKNVRGLHFGRTSNMSASRGGAPGDRVCQLHAQTKTTTKD